MSELGNVPYSMFSGAQPSTGPVQPPGLWISTGKGYHVITTRYDGTAFTYWVDDVCILKKITSLSSVEVSDLYANIISTPDIYAGSSYAGVIGLWDRALSDTEVRSAVTFQQARAAQSSITATSASRVLTTEGDSITALAGCYPYIFGPNASPVLYGVNYAVAGSVLADLVARSTIVNSIPPPNRSGRKFILSVLVASDLQTAIDVPAWVADIATYLDAARAAGYIVIICTILPRTTSGFNTRRNIANPLLRALVGPHADACCDFDANPVMGPDAAASNPTLYSDGIHPTSDVGQPILETVFRPAINGI